MARERAFLFLTSDQSLSPSLSAWWSFVSSRQALTVWKFETFILPRTTMIIISTYREQLMPTAIHCQYLHVSKGHSAKNPL